MDRRAWGITVQKKRGRALAIACAATAALVLCSSSALAQKKKKGGASPPSGAAASGGASAGGEIELDDPGAAKPATPPAAGQPGAAGGDAAAGGEVELDQPATPPAGDANAGAAAAGGTGGICDIDPSACPKPEDLKAAANKTINAEVYAVQQVYVLRARRLEVSPYWSFGLNDQFVSHSGPGISLNYYISQVLAFGINGTYYGINGDSDFNFQNRREARIGVPLNQYLAQANVNFTYVPFYGKFSAFNNFIFHYDGYVVGGLGGLWDKPIPVIDPDNRNFSYKFNLDFDVGLGLRVFFNRWFAVNLEVRDYIFNEAIENTSVAQTQAQQLDPNTWYSPDSKITNNIQAQIGVSIFFPFSWTYRLPK
ncbi:MAG: outer membrane beta-barrel domain-containing protein [Polyangiaceae bacterium]